LLSSLSGSPLKQTLAISGDPSHFDPYKSLAEAQAFAAKDAQLISITANFVRADGTMDLTATYKPGPSTKYKFVHQVPPPANAPPVGAGGNASDTWYEPVTITAYRPGQVESITRTSGNSRVSYTFVNNGYSRETDDPISRLSDPILAAPRCDLAQLWKVAIQTYDAPPNAVATIEYTANGYDFSIAGTNVSITFDKNCQNAVPPTLSPPVPPGVISIFPLCSPDPDTYRLWQIRNSSSSDIAIWWGIEGTGVNTAGTVVVPAQQASDQPGEVIVRSPAIGTGPNNMLVYTADTRQALGHKIGPPDRCPATPEAATPTHGDF
jgi:hypothetical protein